jgi:hypothetical protein
MYDDSLMAIELDDLHFKSYLKNGEACLELSKSSSHSTVDMCDQGLRRLQKAISCLDRIKQNDSLFASKKKLIQQVEKQILRGRKIRWYKESLIR